MPDQSSASTEHALMQEITAPLSTLPDDPVPVVADVDFPLVLRGYDRDSVDTYVQRTSQLVAELQATRSPEAAVRRALERVGEEVSGILQRAHETASRITAQSRSEAEDRLEAARHEAAQIVRSAEDRVRELDADTDRIWAERQRIVEDTRDLARELLTMTDSAAERFPADSGEEAGLPGLEALPPAEIEAGETETPGIETVPPAPGTADAGEPLPEDGETDAEPTAILPVVEPAEPPEGAEPADGTEPFEPVEWVEPAAADAEEEHGAR
jgi:DivIVA domain-containing protein